MEEFYLLVSEHMLAELRLNCGENFIPSQGYWQDISQAFVGNWSKLEVPQLYKLDLNRFFAGATNEGHANALCVY